MKVFDAHCDTAFELWRKNEKISNNSCHIDLEKASKFDAYAQIFAFCSLSGTKFEQEPLFTEPLKHLQDNVAENAERIAFAENAEEIRRLNDNGRIAAILSMEGPELIDCDVNRLPSLRTQGVRMTTLTWNADNVLAGCHLGENGLSAHGKDFVRTAQELGIYIDVSHLSDKAFYGLLDVTQRPIVASHSNCRSLCKHSRNLTDEQIKQIAQTGGVVGLNLYTPFVCENADFSELRRHLERMLSICSVDHVVLGGDLDGCDTLVSGFSDVGSYRDFYRYLQDCGYSEKLLDQIFYENLLNLF